MERLGDISSMRGIGDPTATFQRIIQIMGKMRNEGELVNRDFMALANTTDAGASGGYSPIKVTIQNADVAGTYV